MTSTSNLNLILPWRRILPLIIFLDLLIKTIPSLPLTSLYRHLSYTSVTSRLFMRYFLYFHAQTFLIYTSTYSPGICLIFYHAMMSRGNWTWPLSHKIPFGSYSLWPWFTRRLHLFLGSFSTCGVQWDFPYQWNFYLLLATSFELGHWVWIARRHLNRCT